MKEQYSGGEFFDQNSLNGQGAVVATGLTDSLFEPCMIAVSMNIKRI